MDGREKGSAENSCFSAEYCEGRRTGIVPCHYEAWQRQGGILVNYAVYTNGKSISGMCGQPFLAGRKFVKHMLIFGGMVFHTLSAEKFSCKNTDCICCMSKNREQPLIII